MAQSITALQQQPNLRVFRKCEIKRRLSTITYDSDWIDVSDYVVQWPNIQVELDTISPFEYRIGQANLSFRNDAKQFSDGIYVNSVFFGAETRYKTLCRISTGLEDEDGVQYPTQPAVFYGVFSDDIVDGEVQTDITVNDIMQVLSEFNASNIAGSVVGIAQTSAQIVARFRDYVPAGSTVPLLDAVLSYGSWFLFETGRNYTIPTTTYLDNMSALDLIREMAIAENYTYYSDSAGNFIFGARTPSTTSDYTFSGPPNSNVNIQEINSINEGIYKLYNKFSCQLFTGTIISTQESFSYGDNSNVSKYGQRIYDFSGAFINTETAGSVCSDLLAYHSTIKKEVDITTKYITHLPLQARARVIYKGEPSGEGNLWGYFLWGREWSGYRGGLKIDEEMHIIGRGIDMNNFKSHFKLRAI